jgi:heavy metal efflux system protein
MNRTLHTNDVIPRVKAEIEKINTTAAAARREAGALLRPHHAGRRHHPYGAAQSVFGCLLVFSSSGSFLGDLRSAIIVGVNIPFALFFSIIILVLRGEDANLLSVGAVDFGIIVDSA